MKNLKALFMLFLISIPAFCQTPSAPPSRPSYQDRIQRLLNPPPGAWTVGQLATMARLRDAAMQDSYALDQLRHLTNNIGPRLSGSPQAAQAVEYVAAEMRSLGADVHLEKTLVPHWVRGAETAELIAWPGQTPRTTQKMILTALGGSGATPADGIQAEVLVVNSFDELRQVPPAGVKGRILLFNEKFDKQLAANGDGGAAYGKAVAYRGAGPTLGKSLGAAAVLVRSVGGADYRLPHTGATFTSPDGPQIPSGAVTAEDADLLADLAHQGKVIMHLTLTPQTLPKVESYNVVADWKGTEHPEQVIVVSGHLDSWDLATGAIDDGAGVAVSMQAVHLLKQLGIHPRRTVRFVAWMDEEQGTEGGRDYALAHAGDLANHIAAIESDLGAGHPTGFFFVGKPALEDFMRPVAHVLDGISAGVMKSAEEAGADIDPLNQKGVPGFAPIQDSRFYFNYHHTPADTFDKVDPRELSENAAVMTVLAYALADSPQPAPR
jgi:carboxypeptidase Q